MTLDNAGRGGNPSAPGTTRTLAAILDEAAAVRQQLDYQAAVLTTAQRRGWPRMAYAARTNHAQLTDQWHALDREAVRVCWAHAEGTPS